MQKKNWKFNLNEDIKARNGLTLVMNLIIKLFLISSAIYNTHMPIYFIIQDSLRVETNSDENLQREKENY